MFIPVLFPITKIQNFDMCVSEDEKEQKAWYITHAQIIEYYSDLKRNSNYL